MELTLERLRRFVRERDSVSILDTTGQTRVLRSGDPDVWDLVAKADKFLFAGTWYSRADFERLLEKEGY